MTPDRLLPSVVLSSTPLHRLPLILYARGCLLGSRQVGGGRDRLAASRRQTMMVVEVAALGLGF
jgi:hypothetical protein